MSLPTMRVDVDRTKDKDKDFLSSLLNRQLHLTVTDGRVFKGTFVCTDRDGSAILSETHEWRSRESRGRPKDPEAWEGEIRADSTRRQTVRRLGRRPRQTHQEGGTRQRRRHLFVTNDPSIFSAMYGRGAHHHSAEDDDDDDDALYMIYVDNAKIMPDCWGSVERCLISWLPGPHPPAVPRPGSASGG